MASLSRYLVLVILPGNTELSFAAQRFAHLHDCLTDFAAHFAYFLLNLSFPAFSFSFGFKAGIVSHFPDLGFHRALDLFGFAFDLIFVPHTCLLEMIVSLEVELWASGELEDSREDEKRVSWTRFSTILCSSMTH
jgi:hypothetical protein